MSTTSPVTPVVLFVFNRHKQLHKTLQCLRKNNIPKLIVFADGARNENDNAGIAKVRGLIDAIDWVPVEKHYSKNNKGLSESIQAGLNKVFKTYQQAIVVEDDVCVAPSFYSYMVTCLDRYKDDERISGVTGLRYPFDRSTLDKTRDDVFLSPRFSSWGWGTWKRQWDTLDFKPKKLLQQIDSKKVDVATGGEDLPHAVEEIREERLTGCWDVYFYMNMVLQQRYFVWPKYNMVANTGLTEGTHAHGEAPSWELKWERTPSDSSELSLPERLVISPSLLTDFLAFFKPENLQKESAEASSRLHIRYNKPRLRGKLMIKKTVNKALGSIGYQITKRPGVAAPQEAIPEVAPEPEAIIDPADYSTTDEPMEVPCQKVVYYHALNNLVTPGSKVLDVGLGLGYGMAILSVSAGVVEGVDVDKKAVAYAKKEYLGKNPKIKRISVYDGYHLPYADNSFDVITCVDVLEHVEDYDAFIKELLRVTKRYVIFGTPNQRPEYTKEDGTPKNPWHLREWKYTELDKIIKAHTKKIEWNFIDGPFEGPFKLRTKPTKDTLVLMPILKKK